MAPKVCQKCGKEIQSGKERLLSEEDMKVIPQGKPGAFKLGLFKHETEADCRSALSN
jgi:hypothetical protein